MIERREAAEGNGGAPASAAALAGRDNSRWDMQCHALAGDIRYAGFRPASRKARKQTCPEGHGLNLDFPEIFGAGDGIRTHDPNLGKVVLYP